LYAIEDAFDQGSRLNIYLEEDMLVSPDLTTLAAWYAAEHRPNWLCLNLIAGPCGSAGLLSNAAFPEQLFEARTFNSLGFVMRPEEWEAHAREAWLGKPGPAGVTSIHARWRWSWGWDWSLYGLVAEGSLLSVQPVLARATHTGREGGVHASPRFHDAAFGKLPINRRRRLRYRLTDVEALPQDVRAHVYLQEEITAMRLQMEAAVTGNDATQTTVPQLRPAPPPANQPEPAGKLRKLRHTLGRMRRGGA